MHSAQKKRSAVAFEHGARDCSPSSIPETVRVEISVSGPYTLQYLVSGFLHVDRACVRLVQLCVFKLIQVHVGLVIAPRHVQILVA